MILEIGGRVTYWQISDSNKNRIAGGQDKIPGRILIGQHNPEREVPDYDTAHFMIDVDTGQIMNWNPQFIKDYINDIS